jgi:inner membrane protein
MAEGNLKKLNRRIGSSITAKFLTVAVLTLLLLIPAEMIEELIREREHRKENVTRDISSKWGKAQTLTGPVLNVPYEHHYQTSSGVIEEKLRYAHFLPESLRIEGEMDAQVRYRSIYQAILYSSELDISGHFKTPSFKEWETKGDRILWKEAFLSFGISDMRGIQESIDLKFDGKNYEAEPGIPTSNISRTGISTRIAFDPDSSKSLPFEFDLKLNGSKELQFVPVGKNTQVSLSSEWDTPSFFGAFLPDKREVDEDGFEAEWKVLHLNRNYPQKWRNRAHDPSGSDFGVSLLFPVDHYQKAHRSAKYAVMFIGLTFVLFFFSEVLNRRRIHPIQYLLVGLALCLFYTMLISFSEHISFAISYLIASLATIMLITAYSASMLRNKRLVSLVGFALVVLYSFLFTILQLEEYALLMGSIGLFLVMAAIMYLSRNVDWYRPIDDGEGEE